MSREGADCSRWSATVARGTSGHPRRIRTSERRSWRAQDGPRVREPMRSPPVASGTPRDLAPPGEADDGSRTRVTGLEGRCSTIELHPRGESPRRLRDADSTGARAPAPARASRHVDHDDPRLQLAAALEPGTTLTLYRADGPLLPLALTAVDGVDVQGVAPAGTRLGVA